MSLWAATSRKLPKPLAVIIQSSPAAGKSALLDAILKLVPEEDVLAFSAITGRSLYYLPADGVKHRCSRWPGRRARAAPPTP